MKKILVVDDEPNNLQVLRQILKDHYQVVFANSGEKKRPYKEPWTVTEAIDEIRRGSGSHFEPRLVALFEKILLEVLWIKDEWDLKEQPAQ